ncbi:MAG: MarR family transcriptional regulator [bacterium]|nr:MarR family transcriptional regulator [bacterium]
MDKYEALKLDNQLCFPLYVCAKEVVNLYRPHLDAIDLTYTQYIAMMVLWEEGSVSSKHLGERLFLDSGTLTPLLRKLEEKGLVERRRSEEDARDLVVTITAQGEALKEKAVNIPETLAVCLSAGSSEDAERFRQGLMGLMGLLKSIKEGKAS